MAASLAVLTSQKCNSYMRPIFISFHYNDVSSRACMAFQTSVAGIAFDFEDQDMD
jgi:hypothetical protein